MATIFTAARPASGPATATAELTTGLASIDGPHRLTPTYVKVPSSTCTMKNPSTTKSPKKVCDSSPRLYKRAIRLPLSDFRRLSFQNEYPVRSERRDFSCAVRNEPGTRFE